VLIVPLWFHFDDRFMRESLKQSKNLIISCYVLGSLLPNGEQYMNVAGTFGFLVKGTTSACRDRSEELIIAGARWVLNQSSPRLLDPRALYQSRFSIR
jgi:hypothetical protein